MSWLRLFVSRIRGMIRARQLDRDLEQQIAAHLEEAADEYVRQGLSPQDARQHALRSFGSVSRVREAWRDACSFAALDHWRRDLRHAGRRLRRSPGFSLIVLVVLAMGTSGVTSVFALLNAVVLQPLPYVESDCLVVVRHAAPGLGVEATGVSSGLYHHYLESTESFESLAMYRERVLLNLHLPGEGTQRVEATYASAALFKVLRTRPAIGRLFTEEDGRPGFMNMKWRIPVLLSHAFWVDRFGRDPNITGRILMINDSPREVVGVLPEEFTFPRAETQMWILWEPSRSSGNYTRDLSWNVLARMRPGVTAASAQLELGHVLRGIERVDPDVANARLAPLVTPLKDAVVGDAAAVIWLLFGGMALLLLVASANAGGLFLVRAAHRAREMAVRRALGAHAPHVARLFFIEALVLAIAGTTIGLLATTRVLPAVIAYAPYEIPRTSEIELDATSIFFASIVAVLMAGFYGLLSSRRQGQSLTVGLSSGGQWATKSRRGFSGPDALIVLQVALALTLMAGSALMVETYRNLSQRDLGFSPGDVLTLEIGLPSRKAAARHVRIYNEVVERIRQIPDVDDASAASFLPLTASEDLFPVEPGGTPVPFKFFVSGYFQTMRTPIVEGEDFARVERATARYPVLVSAALARRLYPGERAVGRPLRRLNEDGSIVHMAHGPLPPFTIAGVVTDVREMTLRGSPTEIVYIPVIEPPVEQSIVPTTMRLVVRARLPVASLAAAVRRTVASVDSDLSVGEMRTLDSIVRAARARETFVGMLLLAAAALSLLLGTVGIYGSVAQVGRQRTREIGIRITLGASRAEVVRLVTAGSVRAVLVGAVLGLVVSLPSSRILSALLFGVDPGDPMVFLAVTGVLVSAAGAAALLAARRAAYMAPLVALRSD